MPKFTVGLDIAKSVFQVHVIDRSGQAVIQRKLRRNGVLKFFAGLEPSVVGIEACHSSHYWGRELIKLGHTVRLLPTQYVIPSGADQERGSRPISDLTIPRQVPKSGLAPLTPKTAGARSPRGLNVMRNPSQYSPPILPFP